MKKASSKHHEPSKASLWEMPEVDFSRAKVRRNPYAAGIAKEGGVTVQVTRGRPKKGDETGTTTPRSIRFPDAVWKQLEQAAEEAGLSLHAALRTAVLEWINHAAPDG